MALRLASWLLILFACFYGISLYPLLDNNEGMYATISRSMLLSDKLVIPELFGLPYMEKPPMLYWLTSASMSVFGINEWAVHLVPALAMFLTALTTYRFGKFVSGSEATGLASALMLSTSLPLLVFSRELLCDMIMTNFFAAAMFELYRWDEREKRGLFRFYALIALAVLTKGLLALILAALIACAYYAWERKPFAHYVRTLSPKGLATLLLVAAPWHILATMQEQGFAWFYFVNEHFMRFINKRVPHDYRTGPVWYYLPRMLTYLVPWTFFLLIFTRKQPLTRAQRFLWSWFLTCLIFFSLAGAKANYYMVLGMPPLFLLTALHLKPYIESGDRVARSLTTGGLALLLATLGLVARFCNENSGDLYGTCQDLSWHYMAYITAYAAVATILIWRLPQRFLPVLLGAHILLTLPILISSVNTAGDLLSQKRVAGFLSDVPADHVALYQEFEELSALGFYLEKPLVFVDSRSADLLYGKDIQRKPGMFVSLEDWAKNPSVPLVLLKSRVYAVLDRLHADHIDILHLCILKRFNRVAIIGACNHDQ